MIENHDFMTAMLAELRIAQADMLANMSTHMEDSLTVKLSQKVWDRLEDSLENALNDRFNELLNSHTVADKVRSYVLNQEGIKEALDIKAAMALVVEHVK